MKLMRSLMVRFDALVRRERVMVFAAGVTMIVGVAFALFIDPDLARAKAARAAIAERQLQLATLRGLQAEYATRLAQDVNVPLRADLDRAGAELAALEGEIKTFHQTLIPAHAMGQVLGGLLQREGGVQLISLRNLAPEPLMTEVDARKPAAGPQAAAPPRALLYRHGMELVVEGGYFELLDYLATLEKQSWRMLWSQTSLVAHYPVSRLTLMLYTLSLDESWLSV